MLNKQDALGYSHELNLVGEIAEVSFIKHTVTLVDFDGKHHVVKRDTVTVLVELGEINGEMVYDRDVVQSLISDDKYELVLQEDGKNVQVHLLDEKFNRVEAGELIAIDEISSLGVYVDFYGGNIFELLQLQDKKEDEKSNFNVNIVKSYKDGSYEYYYACNDKSNEVVDLIKVLYMGHQLLKEESYSRVELSYDQYHSMIKDNELQEVSPQELLNYVTGATYNSKSDEVEDLGKYSSESDEEKGEDLTDNCEDCLLQNDDCDCEPW